MGGGRGGGKGTSFSSSASGVLSSVDEKYESYDDDSDDVDGRPRGAGSAVAPFMDAIVKVYCVHTEPNFSLPWQRKRQYASTSSGFGIRGPKGERWLLTNAHSVEYHSQVKVKRRGDDAKFLARVLAVGTECDIALMTVDDDAFWEGLRPLVFGGLPRLQDAVVRRRRRFFFCVFFFCARPPTSNLTHTRKNFSDSPFAPLKTKSSQL